MSKTNEYKSVLLDAMNIVSKKNLSASSFDQTIECEVVNIDKKDSGIYMVKSDEATFQAYATGTFTYYLHDIVYVTIPGGDYRRQKFIIGRKSDQNDASSVYNLKFPFDDFIKLQEINLNPDDEYGFRANAPEDNKILLGTATFVDEKTGKPAPVSRMTRIGLELDVQTLLGGYYPISGEYGVQIEVTGIVGATKENPAYEVTQTSLFTNKEMYGNSYAYYQFYNQQKIVDISAFSSVSKVDVYFIQEFDFYDEDGAQIPYAQTKAGNDTVSVPMPDNIFLRNIKAYFGMESAELKEEKLFLYTHSPLYYNMGFTGETEEETKQKNDEYDTKKMFFNWVHINDDGNGTTLFKTSEQLDDFNTKLLKSIMDQSKAEEMTTTESIEYRNRKLQVFWFRENLSLPTESSDAEDSIYSILSPLSLYMGPRWQVITADETLANNNAYYYDANFDPFAYTANVSNGYSHQKYKVVVLFGNRKVISSELNFINYVKMDGGASDITTENADMIFKCFTGYYDENEKYCLKYDDISSVGRFYVYDENDNVLMDANGRKYSEIDYYLQLWRRPQVNDSTNILTEYNESVYVPLLYETEPFDATWNFFNRYTMINSSELSDEEVYAFAEHQGRLNENNQIGEEDKTLFRKITKKFTLREKLDSQYKNNEVTAIVEQGHTKYYAHKDFQFGRASSQGSKYTVSIVINDDKDTYLAENTNATLSCQIYDLNNELIEAASYKWRLINQYDKEACPTGSEITLVNPGETPWNNANLNIHWSKTRKDGTVNAAPAFEVIVDGVKGCDYELSTKRGLMVGPSTLRGKVIVVPERIEYKSDGTVPYYYKGEFSVYNADASNTAFYPTWSEGQHSGIYPEFTIHDKEVSGCSVDTGVDEEGNTVSTPVVSKHKIYKLTVDKGYMWDQAYADGVIEIINDMGVRQAIVQAQNVYPSSLVNSWDGITLSIDEKTNSVLANRIAAGTKTNNKFTGVMMGDYAPYGDESVELTGLYGFQNGQQTFGFMEDGTGFIGGEQSGRITFDGTNAMISNFDKTCYINLNPAVAKDLDDRNNTSGSQYFLYAEVNRTEADDDSLNLNWTTKFFKDSKGNQEGNKNNQKDYFIVDPTRGVLTTGGVIARYGYIGEWLINKGGLSWYSNLTDKNISDIIYLGDWENNPYKDHIANTASAGHTYLISAGTGESGSQIMNFGVTADGYLFSQSGRIGGWNINTTQLYSDGETVVLDGALGSIKIGKMVPDVINPNIVAMEGSVNIAGYEIIGLAGGASFASGSDLSSNEITVDFGSYEEVTWESSNSAYPVFPTSGIKDTLILYNSNIEYDEFKASYKESDILVTDVDLKEYTVTMSQENLGTKNLWIYTKFYNNTNNILFSESDRADKDWRVVSTNLSSAINEILDDNNATLDGNVTVAFTTFYLVNNYILNITDNNWRNVIETVALDSNHTTLWRYIAIKLTFKGKKSDGTTLNLETTINTPGESLLVYDVDKEVVTTTTVATIDTLSTSSYAISDSVKYNIASLNEWKVIKDISNNKLGILLSTGLGEKIIKNDDANTDTIISPIITFNPVYNNNDPALAFLGTPDREWTIICGNELYMNKNLVATQLWANTDIKVPLLQKIAEVSKAASSAIALGNKALGQANTSLAQVRDLAKKAVHTITLTQKGGVPSNGIGLKFSAKNKYGTTICSFESNNWPSFAHRHNLSISGNSITVGSASGKSGCDISKATVIQDLIKRVAALESHTHSVRVKNDSFASHTHSHDNVSSTTGARSIGIDVTVTSGTPK